MRQTLMFVVAGAAIVLCSAPAMAQTTVKRQPYRILFDQVVYSAESAIEAVLQLSDEQATQISTALRETSWAPAVTELQTKGNDKSLSEAERKTFMDQFRAARAKADIEYKKRRDGILTESQRASVEKMNAAAKAVDQEIRAEYKPKVAVLEGDEKKKVTTEMTDKIKTVAAEKIRALLTPEQAEALAKAK